MNIGVRMNQDIKNLNLDRNSLRMRLDGRDLIQEWLEKHPNSHYVWNKSGFDKIDVEKTNRLMGI